MLLLPGNNLRNYFDKSNQWFSARALVPFSMATGPRIFFGYATIFYNMSMYFTNITLNDTVTISQVHAC